MDCNAAKPTGSIEVEMGGPDPCQLPGSNTEHSDTAWLSQLLTSYRAHANRYNFFLSWPSIDIGPGPAKTCGRIYDDKLCRGINQSATQFKDWRECTFCKGDGRNMGLICQACDGSGWMFVGGRTWHREDP